MAEAVGITAASLQFLSAANTCLTIFLEFKHDTPESHRVLGFRLEAEAAKFQEWCSVLSVQEMLSSSVNKDVEERKKSREMKEFQAGLRRMLRFDNERVADMIVEVLQDMVKKLQLARSMIQPDYIPSTGSQNVSKSRLSPVKRLFRTHKAGTVGQLAPPSQTTNPSTSSLTSRGSGMFSGVKWVLRDKKTFITLLEDITSVNECLGTFLAGDDKEKLRRRFQANILRTPGLDLGDAADLREGDHEVRTMAVIAKELRVVAEQEDSSVSQTVGEMKAPETSNFGCPAPDILELDDFDGGSLEFGQSRSFSSLGQRPVLIEWANHATPINYQHLLRRGNVACLLSDSGIYRKFHTLPSRAIVMDSKNSRVGLVFEAPANDGKERALLDLLERPTPALGHRFYMARALSTAMHSLQLVNWLHKSIRSDNLLCFENPPQEPERSQDQTADILRRQAEEPPELYLMGWYLSRSSKPEEMSQSLSISTQGYKLTKEMIRLTSHPDSLATDQSSPRPRFKAEYDVYSFGLILLEIGLWRSLPYLRTKCKSDDEFRDKVKGEFCNRLLPTMGGIYWAATKRCLHNKFDRALGSYPGIGLDTAEANEVPLSLAFERQVVSELEKCLA